MDKKYHWISGFIIYIALLMLMNHFINYALDSNQFMIFAVLSYATCITIIVQRKWFIRLFVITLLLIGSIYILEGILETVFMDEITIQNDLITSSEQNEALIEPLNENSELKTIEPSLGYAFYQNVHMLRLKLDYEIIFDFVKWLTEYRNVDNALVYSQFEKVLFMSMSFALALILQLIMRYRYSKILLIVPFFAFVWMWYQYIDLPRKVYAYYFIGVFIFYVLDRQDYLKKQTQYYGQSHYGQNGLFKFASVLSILMIITTVFVTAVFPLGKVNQLTDPIIPNFWGGRSGYSSESIKMYTLNDTPYQSNDNQLGGPITSIDRDTVLFWVQTDQNLKDSLYLKGNVKDFYDGYQWLSHANTYKKAYEFFLSDSQNRAYLSSETTSKISGTIRLDHMDTVTLFTPMGLYDTSLGDKVFVSIDNEAFYKAGAFVKFLSEYKFSAANKDFLLSKEVDYLQLPGNIDNGTYQLARNLGNYGLTEYEKMVIMTKFLLQNYDYTLYPPEYNKDREFVSKFIFETRAGYCTYFATALTVMARINDIPARYVEGFRVDPGEAGKDGFTAVTEGDAHAWCEVYLEDKGWVVFESTPPYAEGELSLERKNTTELNAIIDEAGNTILAPISEELSTFKEGLLEANMILGDDGGNSGNVKPSIETSKPIDLKRILMGILIGILTIIVMILLSSTWINRRVIKPNGTRKRALRMVYYMVYLLKALYPEKGVLMDNLLRETDLTQAEQLKILTLVYNSNKAIDISELSETTDLILKEINTLEKHFKLEFGIIKWLKLKIFNLRKIVL